MKKFFAFAIVALTVLGTASCRKNNLSGEKEVLDIVGVWELSAIDITKAATLGDETVNVYVDFAPDNSFTLYQLLGEGRYSVYTGSWTLSGDYLFGNYSDGSNWASSYTITVSKVALVLTTSDGSQITTYRRIDEVPASVFENIKY